MTITLSLSAASADTIYVPVGLKSGTAAVTDVTVDPMCVVFAPNATYLEERLCSQRGEKGEREEVT